MHVPCKLLGFVCVFINDNNLEDDQELLAPTTCRVAMMIAAKNGAVTTAIASITTVRAPSNFVNTDQITPYAADQTFCLKLSHGFNILLNILQSPYIAVMFLRAVFSMFALQMIF